MTDLLLGVIRTIVENKPNDESKGCRTKNEVVIGLLKNFQFYTLIQNIKFYEWSNTKQLTEVDFRDYMQLFIANNYDKWRL